MNQLEGKVALVTGGTRGIGRAIVERLLAEGCRVAFCGTNETSVQAATAELEKGAPGRVFGYQADVCQPDSVQRLFAAVGRAFGNLNILVNNAGIGRFASVAEMSAEIWNAVISTNLTGVYLCCHAAIPFLRNSGGGFIVNIGSLAGKNAFAGGAAYNASKFGLAGFTEALFLDHRQENIRACCVMPGSVSTDFNPAGKADWKIAPEDIAEVVAMVVKMPERTMISQVDVRPSRPRK